jgi:hypothetical protein
MRFSCERCHKAYSSREDPVPGRVYRIGCRCGHIIVVGPCEGAPPSSATALSGTALRVVGSPHRAAPPPLPWTRTRSPGPGEPRGAGPREAPGLPGPALAPDPESAALAMTPTPSPLPVDDEMLIPLPPECSAPSAARTLARAARASFEAGVAAWRSERARSRALRAQLAGDRRGGESGRRPGASIAPWQRQRPSWGTLLAACTVSTAAAALLTSWTTRVVPRRGGEPTATVARVVAATLDASPGAATDARVARVEGQGPALQTPAAAPARSGRREATRPAPSVPRAVDKDDEIAAPARAEAAADAPHTAAEPAPSVAEPSDPAPDARPDAAAPNLRGAPSGGAEPEDVAGAPFATAASVRRNAHAPRDGSAAPAAIPAGERADGSVPAGAVAPDGGPSDRGLPSDPDSR